MAANCDVEKILGKRTRVGQVEYLVKWLDHDVDEATWVPARWCDCAGLINSFEMDGTEEFEVEKVLDKRVKFGETQYLIKWLGFPSTTWVKDSLCNCDEAIKDYEIGRLHKIVGVKVVDSVLHYAIKLKKESEIAFIPNGEAADKWLLEVLKYLEDHTRFRMPHGNDSKIGLDEVNKGAIRDKPKTVLAATDLIDHLEYMFEWSNGRKIGKGRDYPGIAVAFLESKIDWNLIDDAGDDSFRETRQTRSQDFERNPLVNITRNLAFERYILRGPAPIVDRRHTSLATRAPQRGRKRLNPPILSLALQVNPDNRHVASNGSPHHQSTSNQNLMPKKKPTSIQTPKNNLAKRRLTFSDLPSSSSSAPSSAQSSSTTDTPQQRQPTTSPPDIVSGNKPFDVDGATGARAYVLSNGRKVSLPLRIINALKNFNVCASLNCSQYDNKFVKILLVALFGMAIIKAKRMDGAVIDFVKDLFNVRCQNVSSQGVRDFDDLFKISCAELSNKNYD